MSDTKLSPNGVPIGTGAGVAAVRRLISENFQKARDSQPITSIHPTQQETVLAAAEQAIDALRTKQQVIYERPPLSELATPYLRAAEKRFPSFPVRQYRHHRTYRIAVPQEDSKILIEQSCRVVSETPQSEDRFDIGTITWETS
jgi:hypothetical protein